jgi:hypothetical protein
MKSNEQIGAEAANIARTRILQEAGHVKLTTKKVLQRISEGLDANENKVFYDKDRGKCIISPDLIAHGVRLDAAKLGATVLDMIPSQKIDANVNHQGNIMAAVVNHLSGNKPAAPKVKEKSKKAKK